VTFLEEQEVCLGRLFKSSPPPRHAQIPGRLAHVVRCVWISRVMKTPSFSCCTAPGVFFHASFRYLDSFFSEPWCAEASATFFLARFLVVFTPFPW